MKDPLSWREPDPYEILTRAGIGPFSTHAEVQKASFVLMTSGGMSAKEREAWNELRLLERRLLIDLFRHPSEPTPDAGAPPPSTAYAFGAPLIPLEILFPEPRT